MTTIRRARPANLAVLGSTLRRLVPAITLACAILSLGQTAGSKPTSPASVPAARQASNVAIITIRDEIKAVTVASVARRIDAAVDAGADALVFDLDTPGGEVGAVLEICDLIKASPVPNTVAWVNRRAYSGGAIIALACREIVTNEPATFGDALPIQSLFGMLNRMPEAERQKIIAPLINEVVESARLRGYDEKLVQGVVSRGVELWLVEHLESKRRVFIGEQEYRLLFEGEPMRQSPGVAAAAPLTPSGAPSGETPPDGAQQPDPANPTRFVAASAELSTLGSAAGIDPQVPTQRPIFSTADRGRWRLVEYVSDGQGLIVLKAGKMREYGLSASTIKSDDELRVFFGAKNLRRLHASWSEGLVHSMTHPIARGVLVVVFLLGLFLEMVSPGLIVPGAVAGLALFGLLAPPLLVGMASWWEIAAVAVGILLVALEIFVIPGFGVAGVLGVLLLLAGMLGTFAPQGSEGLFPDTVQGRRDLAYGAVTLVLSVATAGVGMYLLARHFGSLPVFGRLVLKDPEPEPAGDDLLAALTAGPTEIRVGDVGKALSPLRPAGRVEIGGRIVDVVAGIGYIPEGSSVRVTSVSGFRITVEAEPAPGRHA